MQQLSLGSWPIFVLLSKSNANNTSRLFFFFPSLERFQLNSLCVRFIFQEPLDDALGVSGHSGQSAAAMVQQLQNEIWFHGMLSRKESERLLTRDGDFLVRESGTTPGQYVLTGQQGGQPKHLLLVDPEGVVSQGREAHGCTFLQQIEANYCLFPQVRTKDHRFGSVSHLISYHMDNRLPIVSAGSEVFLQQPVERRA